MKKLALVACASLLSLASCGGDPDQAACQEYVETYNAVYRDCEIDSSLDAEIQCPESLSDDGCSQQTYYECLRDAPHCEDDGTVTNDPSVCNPSCG